MTNDPKPNRRDSLAREITNAQLHIVEQALVAFLEDFLGRVPSDGEILKLGWHVNFADTPLAVYVKDGYRFHQYYVWDSKEVVAIGFLNPKAPIELQIVRVPHGEWPVALRITIENANE
jgi:hypothetical protein